MDSARAQSPPDPEFQPPSTERLIELDHAPESYQRLLANPFLGFLGIIVWVVAMQRSVIGGFAGPLTPMLLVLLIASLWLLPTLFQYHCLDCGATGRLSRWRRHNCHRVSMRRLAGRPRRMRGPTPPVQVIVWLWAIVAFALLAHGLGWSLPWA